MRSLLLAAALIGPAGTGDVNGDRVADVLLPNRVVFGGKGSLRRARGFKIVGASARTIAGDVNGDGLDDVLLSRRGTIYVAFGQRGRRTVDARRGIRIPGTSAAGVGDMDGDGLDDVIVGAPEAGGGAGAAWVVRGRRDAGRVDLAAAHMRIDGAPEGDVEMCDAANWESGDPPPYPPCRDGAGWSVAGVGDVNGDRIPDVALDAGRPAVVFGRRAGGNVALGALGADGFRISGVSAETVHKVAAAGDVDGDGLADLTLVDFGAFDARLVFGGTEGLDYRAPGSRAVSVSSGEGIDDIFDVGDFNGDGRRDLAMAGAEGNDGVVYVAFGARRPGPIRFGRRGVRIPTRDNEPGVALPSVAPAGDVNADGRDDILVTDGDGTQRIVLGGRRPRTVRFR